MALIDPTAFLFSTTLAGASVVFLMVISRPGLREDQAALFWWIAGDIAFCLHRVLLLIRAGELLPATPYQQPQRIDFLMIAEAGLILFGLACGVQALSLLCRQPFFGRRLPIALLIIAPIGAMAGTYCLLDYHAGSLAIMCLGTILTAFQMVAAWPGVARSRGLTIFMIGNGLVVLLLMIGMVGILAQIQSSGATANVAVSSDLSTPFIPNIFGMTCDFVASILRTFAILLVMQERQRDFITRLSTTDHLTGALNRRGAMPILRKLLQNASRHDRCISFAILDIDHFKRVNDRFGHEAGDHVLSAFAEALLNMKCKSDFLARWGGEEFLLLMPDTDADGAIATLERFRTEIPARIAKQAPCPVTFSAGVVSAVVGCKPLAIEEIFRKADLCLYQAKIMRNCVVAQVQELVSDAPDYLASPKWANSLVS